MKLKKILASILCVAMVLSTVGFNVFAEDTTETVVDSTYVAQVGDEKFESVLSAITYALEKKAPELKLLADSREVMTSDYAFIINADLKITAEAPVTAAFYNDGTNNYDFAVGANGDYTLTIGENVTFDLEDRVIWLGIFDENCTVVVDGTLTCANLWVGTKTVVNSTGKLISDTHEFVMRKDANLVVNGGTVEASYFQLYTGHIEATNDAKIISHGLVNVNGAHNYSVEGDFSISLDNSTFKSDGAFNIVAAESWTDGVEITLVNGSSINTVAAFGTTGEVNVSVDATSSVTDKNGTVVAPLVEVTTYEELVAALAKENANIILKKDITAAATQSSGYGVAGIVVDAGDVLDGDGHKLTITGANTTWDCAVAMKGGAVKNLTIAGAMRGVFMPGANGDVVIDNCKFKDVIYTFNSDGGNKNYKVTIKNTVLNGWTSFSDVHGSVTFENCEFGEGSGYAFCRPYQPTTFTGCEFNKGFEFDAKPAGDNTLAFNDCKYDGEELSTGAGAEMFYNGGNIKIDGEEAKLVKDPVASVGLATFATLKEAVAAAKDGDTIQLIEGVTIEEGELAIPDVFKNVTIKGAKGASLKNTHLARCTGGSAIEGLTIDGVVFDNSHIRIVAWDNNTSLKDWTIINSTFKNLDAKDNIAPVHLNVGTNVALENLTFKNNVVQNLTGGDKSGIYGQYTGNVLIENNTFDNIAFRPYLIQLTSDDGIADSLIVKNNTFSGSAKGRAQALTNNAEGTDSVNLVVTNNIFKGITDAQQICYWNFNDATTTATLEKNYYDIDVKANPNRIYYNKAAANAADLVDMGIFPFYDKLNEDGTIDTSSIVGGKDIAVAMIENTPYMSIQKAVNAAEAGDVITLQHDFSEKVVIAAPAVAALALNDDAVVIDLNGKTLNGYILIQDSSKNIEIKNGNIVNEDSTESAIESVGTLTVTDVNITSARHAINVEGGNAEINGGNFALIQKDVLTQNVIGAENAVVIINDGVFTGPAGTTADSGAAVAAKTGSTVTINGGKFSGGKNNTIAGKGTLVVNGGMFDQDVTAYIAETSEAIDRGAYEYPYGVAPKAAGKINVALKATDNKNVYNIVITSADEYDINEFVSAELTFKNESTTVGGSVMDYKINGYADNKTFAQEAKDAVGLKDNEEQYIISLNDGAKRLSSTDAKDGDGIIIGQVEFFGQGDIKFSVTKGEVDTTWQNTNLGRYYTTEVVAPATEATLGIENASINSNVPEVHRDVAVNVAFNHNIDTEKYWGNYQITATIKNSAMNYTEPKDITIKDIKSGACVFEDVPVGYITITLKAPGFRTYTYNTTLEETKDNGVLVLNFWNDVKKGNDEAIEKGKDKMAHNFLVGDIVMDMKVDKYDLAAVTSYYGTYGIDKAEAEKYIKYDLNRDGDIDIRDVQYVLHTMGN